MNFIQIDNYYFNIINNLKNTESFQSNDFKFSVKFFQKVTKFQHN